jgi:hypothetical protein
LVLFFGIFLGSVLGGLRVDAITFDIPITGFVALVGGYMLIMAIIIIAGIFAEKSEFRIQLFSCAGIGLIAFLFILVGGSVYYTDARKNEFTIDEVLILSEYHAKSHNYERAIELLELADDRVLPKDPRDSLFKQKINKMEQVK